MMRPVLASLAVFAVAACSAEAPPPYEQRGPAVDEASQAVPVTLRGDGLSIEGELLPFSAEREEVETALAGVLGEVLSQTENGECGAGPMAFGQFSDGLTVNFQQGRFVGWYIQDPSERIATKEGIAIGSARDAVSGETGFAIIEGSTLGEEFALEDRMGGFLDAGEVSGLYAGTNCFFR